jgi:hypothetical protein
MSRSGHAPTEIFAQTAIFTQTVIAGLNRPLARRSIPSDALVPSLRAL